MKRSGFLARVAAALSVATLPISSIATKVNPRAWSVALRTHFLPSSVEEGIALQQLRAFEETLAKYAPNVAVRYYLVVRGPIDAWGRYVTTSWFVEHEGEQYANSIDTDLDETAANIVPDVLVQNAKMLAEQAAQTMAHVTASLVP